MTSVMPAAATAAATAAVTAAATAAPTSMPRPLFQDRAETLAWELREARLEEEVRFLFFVFFYYL